MLIKLLRIWKEKWWNVMYDNTQCGRTPRAFESPMTPVLSIRPEDTGVSWKIICSLISQQTRAPTGTMCGAVPTRGWMDGFFSTFSRGHAHPQAPFLTRHHPRNYLHLSGLQNPFVPRPTLHIDSHRLMKLTAGYVTLEEQNKVNKLSLPVLFESC